MAAAAAAAAAAALMSRLHSHLQILFGRRTKTALVSLLPLLQNTTVINNCMQSALPDLFPRNRELPQQALTTLPNTMEMPMTSQISEVNATINPENMD